jgi:HIRAN domain
MVDRRRLVPIDQDFTDARSALAASRSVGRVHFAHGVRAPYAVRGESSHQDALTYLRRHATSGGRLPALLVREPDSRDDENAVAVMVYGHTVGYLSRDDAADLADRLDELADLGQFLACPAELVNGTGDRPDTGVVVLLREATGR